MIAPGNPIHTQDVDLKKLGGVYERGPRLWDPAGRLDSAVLTLTTEPSGTFVSAKWIRVEGGDHIRGLQGQEVRWGKPTGLRAGGLRFDPAGTTLPLELHEPFPVGDLTHFNFPVRPGTEPQRAALLLHLTLERASVFAPLLFNIGDAELPLLHRPIDQTYPVAGVDLELRLLGFGPSPKLVEKNPPTEAGLTNVTTLWATLRRFSGRPAAAGPFSRVRHFARRTLPTL